jgi:hypothetical protein
MIKSEGGLKRTGDFFWSVVNFSFEKDIIGHIFTGQYYGLHMQGLLKKNEKKLARSFNFFLYEVCLIRIKEQVGEKGSIVCTHR